MLGVAVKLDEADGGVDEVGCWERDMRGLEVRVCSKTNRLGVRMADYAKPTGGESVVCIESSQGKCIVMDHHEVQC